jgi:hypothetical protein
LFLSTPQRSGSWLRAIFDLTAAFDSHLGELETLIRCNLRATKVWRPYPNLDQELFLPTGIDPNDSFRLDSSVR